MSTGPFTRQSAVSASHAALKAGFLRSSNGMQPDAAGYLAQASTNLVEGVNLGDVEADIRQGDGNELAGKFRAIHSSTALAVNVFGPFKRLPGALHLAGRDGFLAVDFERKCPHGLRRGNPPNLDVVAEAQDRVVAVESKCTEYLGNSVPKFSPAYEAEIRDERRAGPWFATMLRLVDRPAEFRRVDAAQLVKHAFGLARTFRGRDVTLFYAFWEPSNPAAWPAFAEHRAELDRFAELVAGGYPSFTSTSYQELWSGWGRPETPEWLHAHVGRLRRRYLVEV